MGGTLLLISAPQMIISAGKEVHQQVDLAEARPYWRKRGAL